jgi:hypothetical protein
MFRRCSVSEGKIVSVTKYGHHNIDRTAEHKVNNYKKNITFPLLTSALNGRLQSVTIPEAAILQFDLLKMSIVMVETCIGS